MSVSTQSVNCAFYQKSKRDTTVSIQSALRYRGRYQYGKEIDSFCIDSISHVCFIKAKVKMSLHLVCFPVTIYSMSFLLGRLKNCNQLL